MVNELEIIAVTHREDDGLKNYLAKLDEAISYEPSIILGPDYGLCSFDKNGKIRFNLRDKLIEDLESISRKSPRTLVIPGTTPFLLQEGYMGHSAMIFKNGNKIEEFRKETDVGDSNIAKENGLVYKSGDCSKNHLNYDGKEIAVEICSDHGKQRFEKDPFVELISAYDDRAGFYIGAHNDNFARWAVICDGRKPFSACYRYDPSKGYGILKGKNLSDSITKFKLDENSVFYI